MTFGNAASFSLDELDPLKKWKLICWWGVKLSVLNWTSVFWERLWKKWRFDNLHILWRRQYWLINYLRRELNIWRTKMKCLLGNYWRGPSLSWLPSVALEETSNIVITLGYLENVRRSCWYISSYVRRHACIICIPDCNTKPSSATLINVSNVTVFPYQGVKRLINVMERCIQMIISPYCLNCMTAVHCVNDQSVAFL